MARKRVQKTEVEHKQIDEAVAEEKVETKAVRLKRARVRVPFWTNGVYYRQGAVVPYSEVAHVSTEFVEEVG